MNRKKKRTQQMCTHKQETPAERDNNSGSEEERDGYEQCKHTTRKVTRGSCGSYMVEQREQASRE
jgi:hypothetical protein